MKLISLLLSFCFQFENILYSIPIDASWHTAATNSARTPGIKEEGVSLSPDIAEIYDSSSADGEKKIINIQDAHASLEAQNSISAILNTLVSQYDMNVVALEGSSGYIDTSVLRTFPDEAIKEKTARELMRQGRMSAGEFFAVTSKKDIRLYGVEDQSLYEKNLDEFRAILDIYPQIVPEIRSMKAACRGLAEKVYSDDIKRFLASSVPSGRDRTSFSDNWTAVRSAGDRAGIGLGAYPNLLRLSDSLELEKNIDFKKATRERASLIRALSEILPKTGMEELVRKSMAFNDGGIPEISFLYFLFEKASEGNIRTADYSYLISYRNYLENYGMINVSALLTEISAYEKDILYSLFTSGDQRDLYELEEFTSLTEDLFEVKLFGSDIPRLVYLAEKFTPEYIASFLDRVCEKHLIRQLPGARTEKIRSALNTALEFYRTADARNSVMIKNTLARMTSEKAEVAALVTGGYHSKDISEILKNSRTSYVIISPKFDTSKAERPYVAILTRKKEAYTSLLRAGTHYIATSAYFDPAKPADIRLLQCKEDIIWAVKGIVNTAKDSRQARAMMYELFSSWSSNYAAFYNTFVSRQKTSASNDGTDMLTPEKFEAFLRNDIAEAILPEPSDVSADTLLNARERAAGMEKTLFDDKAALIVRRLKEENIQQSDLSKVYSRVSEICEELGIGGEEAALLKPEAAQEFSLNRTFFPLAPDDFAVIDTENTVSKRYADPAKLSISDAENEFTTRSIRTPNGIRNIALQLSRKNRLRTCTIKIDDLPPVYFRVDRRFISCLDRYGLDIERCLEDWLRTSAAIRGPDHLRLLSRNGAITIAVLDTSAYLVEHSVINRFIGINNIVFGELLKPELIDPDTVKDIAGAMIGTLVTYAADTLIPENSPEVSVNNSILTLKELSGRNILSNTSEAYDFFLSGLIDQKASVFPARCQLTLPLPQIRYWENLGLDLKHVSRMSPQYINLRLQNEAYYLSASRGISKKTYSDRHTGLADTRSALIGLLDRPDVLRDNYVAIRTLVKVLPRLSRNIHDDFAALESSVEELDDIFYDSNRITDLRQNIHGHLSKADKFRVRAYLAYLTGDSDEQQRNFELINENFFFPDESLQEMRDRVLDNIEIAGGRKAGEIDKKAERVVALFEEMIEIFEKCMPGESMDEEGDMGQLRTLVSALEEARRSTHFAANPDISARTASLMSTIASGEKSNIEKLTAIARARRYYYEKIMTHPDIKPLHPMDSDTLITTGAPSVKTVSGETRLHLIEFDTDLEQVGAIIAGEIYQEVKNDLNNTASLSKALLATRYLISMLAPDGMTAFHLREYGSMLAFKDLTYLQLHTLIKLVDRDYDQLNKDLNRELESQSRIILARTGASPRELDERTRDYVRMILRWKRNLRLAGEFIDILNKYADVEDIAARGDTFTYTGQKELIESGMPDISLLQVTSLARRYISASRILYGGKGTDLIDLTREGFPVPPAFIIPTTVPKNDLQHTQADIFRSQVMKGISGSGGLESQMREISGLDRRFGDTNGSPLLLSIRSGATVSMPGIMDTILNIGMNGPIADAWAEKKSDPGHKRFVYECYLHFLESYAKNVYGRTTLIEKDPANPDLTTLAEIKTRFLGKTNKHSSRELTWSELKDLCAEMESRIKIDTCGFKYDLQNVQNQVFLGIDAVFKSWNSENAEEYRRMKNISKKWLTPAIVQCMVFGNYNDDSGSGVVSTTRDPSGKISVIGNFAVCAQGEDIVSGSIPGINLDRMASSHFMKELEELAAMADRLYSTRQDIEFTVEDGILWILQSRAFFPKSKLSTRQLAETNKFFYKALKGAPGILRGIVVFDTANIDAIKKQAVDKGLDGVIILIPNADPHRDAASILLADGLITSSGGNSHAIILASSNNKVSVSGANIMIDGDRAEFYSMKDPAKLVGVLQKGDIITIDGDTGMIYLGKQPLEEEAAAEKLKPSTPAKYAENFVFVKNPAEITSASVDRFRIKQVLKNEFQPQFLDAFLGTISDVYTPDDNVKSIFRDTGYMRHIGNTAASQISDILNDPDKVACSFYDSAGYDAGPGRQVDEIMVTFSERERMTSLPRIMSLIAQGSPDLEIASSTPVKMTFNNNGETVTTVTCIFVVTRRDPSDKRNLTAEEISRIENNLKQATLPKIMIGVDQNIPHDKLRYLQAATLGIGGVITLPGGYASFPATVDMLRQTGSDRTLFVYLDPSVPVDKITMDNLKIAVVKAAKDPDTFSAVPLFLYSELLRKFGETFPHLTRSTRLIVGVNANNIPGRDVAEFARRISFLTDGQVNVVALKASSRDEQLIELREMGKGAGNIPTILSDLGTLDSGSVISTLKAIDDAVGLEVENNTLRTIERFILASLPGIGPVDIDEALIAMKKRSILFDPSSGYRYTNAAADRFKKLSGQARETTRKQRLVSATTTGVIDNGLSWSARIQARWEKTGVLNMGSDPISEFVIVSDPRIGTDPASVRTYLKSRGLEDYIPPDNVIFAETASEAAGIISRKTGLAAQNIGIRALREELRPDTPDVTLLQLDKTAEGLYANINLYEILFDIICSPQNEPVPIKGLTKLGERLFIYIPPSIPGYFMEEMKKYRIAVERIAIAA